MVGVPVKDQDLLDTLGLGAAGTHSNLGEERLDPSLERGTHIVNEAVTAAVPLSSVVAGGPGTEM